jgi:hypothetical protein
MTKIKKYRLLKDLPNVDAGAVFERSDIVKETFICKDKYGSDQYFDECVLMEQTGWFAPYAFKAEDGDIFVEDTVYCVFNSSPNEIHSQFVYKLEHIKNPGVIDGKGFTTKEKAQEYLDSLKPKFKVGDIVNFKNNIVKITNFEQVEDETSETGKSYIYQIDKKGLFKNINEVHFKPAIPEEIIQYYEKQGWVKGAKFKCGGDIDKVHSLCFLYKEIAVQFESTREIKQLRCCELIKEPVYPKSFEEIEFNGSRFYHIEDDCIGTTKCKSKLNFATEKQAISSSAYSQLTQLHKAMIDEYNIVNGCDWKPDWNNDNQEKFVITRTRDRLNMYCSKTTWSSLPFPDNISAEFALEHWNELWKQYFEL